MSMHRAKATIIGLLEASRVNEWVVTEKLGNANRHRNDNKSLRKFRQRIGERVQLTELFVGLYLVYCGIYDIMYGRDHFWIYLFTQAIAFFIVGVGYVGTIVPT